MTKPLTVIRPHDWTCAHCRPAWTERASGQRHEAGVGHYECQATDCAEPADFTWPRKTELATEPMLACAQHALPVEARSLPHRRDCPAPDPGCDCTW